MLQDLEISLIKSLQGMQGHVLDILFQAITMLGEESFYILIFTALYWCVNKKESGKFIMTFLLSNYINTGLKVLFHRPRPIGDDGIRSLREHTATGYSFPSGHTQSAATFFYYIIDYFRKTWITILGTILVLAVAVSRLYLGVHWPTDVVASLALSVLIVQTGKRLFEELTLIKVLVLVVCVSITPFFFSSEGHVGASALFSGGLIGLYLEQRFLRYEITRAWKNHILKYILGIAILLAIKIGLKMILPDLLIYRYLRYFLMGFWVTFGSLGLFKAIRI